MTLDLAKLRAETLALIQNHGGDLELRLRDSSPRFPHAYIKTRNGQTVADLRYSVTRNYNMGTLFCMAPTLAADTLRLLDEIERLSAENARLRARALEAEAEVGRWRQAKGPLDEGMTELSSMLIAADCWPDPAAEVASDEEETEADYRAAAKNLVDASKMLIQRLEEAGADSARLRAERDAAWQAGAKAMREAVAYKVAESGAIVDHPSVFMGGPSRNAIRIAGAFAAAIRDLPLPEQPQ